jgi:hypothetical protein
MMGQCCPEADFIRGFLMKAFRQPAGLMVWSEAAVPFIVCAALLLEAYGQSAIAEGSILVLVGAIARANSARNSATGLPDPYYDVEEAVRVRLGMEELVERFRGFSYTLEPLVQFLARRMRKQALRNAWEDVTRVQFSQFTPATGWQWFRWRATDGSLDNRMPPKPQSWGELVQAAEDLDVSGVPALLRDRPAFLLSFLLVYPHRFSKETLKIIEDAVAAPQQAKA